MQLCHRTGQWVNADFVSGRKERIRVEALVKQKMRRSVYCDGKVVLRRNGIRECLCYFPAHSSLRGFRKRWQVQLAVYPNATLHSRTSALPGQLDWPESDDKSRNHIACLGGKNRYRYYLIDNFIRGVRISADITDLLRLRAFLQAQFRRK